MVAGPSRLGRRDYRTQLYCRAWRKRLRFPASDRDKVAA